jgi:Flp pilus assembly protein protease CpaA
MTAFRSKTNLARLVQSQSLQIKVNMDNCIMENIRHSILHMKLVFLNRSFSSALSVLLLLLPAAMQAQLLYTTNNGAITITGFTGSPTNIVIPSTTNGYPVKSIGNTAFYDCSSLTSVTIPNSVIIIGAYAFEGTSSLTSVTIPNSVTSIGSQAFASFGLTNIAVDAANPNYSSLNGVLFDKAQTTLIQYPLGLGGTYAIPNSVTSIGISAFYNCSNLTSVTIPNSITSIGDSAFLDCSSLTSVTIPNSVIIIGAYAFYGCSNLTSVTIPNSITSIGIYEFALCVNLTNVTIPDSVASIGDAGFFKCTSLTSVTIPNSVTNIGDSAFDECSSLTNVTIGNGVISIGVQAFYGCSSLTSVTIPNSVISIGFYAFSNCFSLTSAYFLGNRPPDNGNAFTGSFANDPGTVYYLPGTTGWGFTFDGLPAVLWNPQAQTTDGSFGVRNNRFGFNITGTTNIPIVVEAAPDLTSSTWTALQSCSLTNGSVYFSDPNWTNYPARFYRFRSP